MYIHIFIQSLARDLGDARGLTCRKFNIKKNYVQYCRSYLKVDSWTRGGFHVKTLSCTLTLDVNQTSAAPEHH